MNPVCTHCRGTLIVGPCQPCDGCCNHDLTCREHGVQYTQSVSLKEGACPVGADDNLPLFAGRGARVNGESDEVRKITASDAAQIRVIGRTRSLRSIASEFGISHTTVRHILKGKAFV